MLALLVLLLSPAIQIPQGQTRVVSIPECTSGAYIFRQRYECRSDRSIVVGVDASENVGTYPVELLQAEGKKTVGEIEVVPGIFPKPVLRPFVIKHGPVVSQKQRDIEENEIKYALSVGEQRQFMLSLHPPMVSPLDAPYGSITDPFWLKRQYYKPGYPSRILTDKTKMHRGVDLATGGKTNVAVRSIGHGVVILATEQEFSQEGYMIIVYHGSGVYSLYLHLAKGSYMVKEGHAISSGDIIAFSGDSGNAKNSPHLHLSVRVNGAVVDPVQLIESFK